MTGEQLARARTRSGLSVAGLTVKRGDLTVCHSIDLDAPAGEITVLLGANGAGKTTLLDAIAGVLPASSGAVRLDGQRVDRMPVHRRAARGLAYVEQARGEQGRSVFTRLTVEQNIAVVDRSKEALRRAFDLFPRLEAKRKLRAGLLSGGEQQMLVIARALATQPRVLLIDELSLGLAPQVVRSLLDSLTGLVESGLGILLVEQFAEMALQVGTTAHIMQGGRIARSGPCSILLKDRVSLLSPYYLGEAPSPEI